MGTDLVEVRYKTLLGSLTEAELDFVEKYFPKTDEGTYFLQIGDSDYTIEAVVTKAKAAGEFEEDKLSELIKTVKKLIRNRKETSVNFVVG
jgi:hypothetical protein